MRTTLHTTQRLFIDTPLAQNQQIVADPKQSHYLLRVLRFEEGQPLRLFNGRDGEYKAVFVKEAKKLALLQIEEKLRPFSPIQDLWLYAAPLKSAHFDFLVQKATELGVAGIQPILTNRTQVRDVRCDRLRSIAIEAAEQSDRLDVPVIQEALKLDKVISSWDETRVPFICAEHGSAMPVREAFKFKRDSKKTAFFTGPEGGFLEEELGKLSLLKSVSMIRLGPRILRADTAAISTLATWQALCGDWVSETEIKY